MKVDRVVVFTSLQNLLTYFKENEKKSGKIATAKLLCTKGGAEMKIEKKNI